MMNPFPLRRDHIHRGRASPTLPMVTLPHGSCTMMMLSMRLGLIALDKWWMMLSVSQAEWKQMFNVLGALSMFCRSLQDVGTMCT